MKRNHLEEMGFKIISGKDVLATNLKVIIYGVPGAGKTTFASTFPKPILFIDCDGGCLSLQGKDVSILQIDKNWDYNKFEKLHLEIQKRCNYKTIVIDTGTELKKKLEIDIIKENENALVVEGYKNWGILHNQSTILYRAFRDLPVNLIVTAHELVEEKNKEDLIRPNLGNNKITNEIIGLFDAVFYMGIEEELVLDENNKAMTDNKGNPMVDEFRYIQTSPTTNIYSKHRMRDLPKIIKQKDLHFDYIKQFLNTVNKNKTETEEKTEPEPIENYKQSLTIKINDLKIRLGLQGNDIQTIFTNQFPDVKSFAEATTEQVQWLYNKLVEMKESK